MMQSPIEYTIQNGVKETELHKGNRPLSINDTIQNGVKIKPALESNEGFMMGTPYVDKFFSKEDVEDTVQNGVKETRWMSDWEDNKVENTIQNGVKGTKIQELDTWDIQKCRVKEVEDIIQNVVKDTKNLQWMKTTLIEDAVQNGVKI